MNQIEETIGGSELLKNFLGDSNTFINFCAITELALIILRFTLGKYLKIR